MKTLLMVVLLSCMFAAAAAAQGAGWIPPHYEANGTFVPGRWLSTSNSKLGDNHDSRRDRNSRTGNQGRSDYNPYSGNQGQTGVQTADGVHGTYEGRDVISRDGRWYYANSGIYLPQGSTR